MRLRFKRYQMRGDIVQIRNPFTDRYVKIDRERGLVLSHKRSKGPYKNVIIVEKPEYFQEPKYSQVVSLTDPFRRCGSRKDLFAFVKEGGTAWTVKCDCCHFFFCMS